MKCAAPLLGWLVLTLFTPHATGRTIPVNACVANLVQIDGAVQQWALERNLTSTNGYSFESKELLSYLKGSALPQCPSGGRYVPGATLTNEPRCTLHGKAGLPIDAERTLEDFRWRSETAKALILSLCALMLVLLGRERPTAQAAAINLVAGIVLALMAGWCTWTIHAEDPRSEFPLWALFLYCSSGVIPFAMLRHNARKWVRVVAFVVMSVLGAVALLILLPAALAKLH